MKGHVPGLIGDQNTVGHAMNNGLNPAFFRGDVLQALFPFPAEALRLDLQGPLFQCPADHQTQLIGGKGFGHDIVGPPLHGFHGQFHSGLAGNDDHDSVRYFFLQALQQFQAVHLRHHQVQQDQVVGFLLEKLPGLGPVFHQCQAQVFPGQQALDAVPDDLFVIDDQQGIGGSGGSHLFFRDLFPRAVDGQPDDKGGPLVYPAGYLDGAPVLLDDAVNRTQSQTDPFAHLLGGEKRVKNFG